MFLTGWKAIAAHMGAGVRTAQRWEHLGLPVYRPVGDARGPVMAYTEDLEGWIRTRREKRFFDLTVPTRQLYEACLRNRELRRQSWELRQELYAQSAELRQRVRHMRSYLQTQSTLAASPGAPAAHQLYATVESPPQS
jgi:hypothetical protein